MQRETMDFDVVIVGAGPAGLSAAIRFKQLCKEHDLDLSVCVLEKGAEVGAHILSGAVLEPKALNELIPNWQDPELAAPIKTAVTEDHFWLLTKHSKLSLPTPPQMRNHGNYIVSLSNVCKWLATQAENLGVEIFPGFAAVDAIYDDAGNVTGVLIGDFGVDKNGEQTSNYQAGIAINAKYTMLAEGCRGSLSEKLIKKFELRKNSNPQTYAIGVKELWQVDNDLFQAGKVLHTIGWPLDHKTYGGSFIYNMEPNLLAIGFVIGLDYQNPYLNPFEELQRFKTHAAIKPFFANGERIGYGARALNEGGWQSVPQLTFPGGLLIGDCAGFLNVAKIKGSHTAMKSGMCAAEAVFSELKTKNKANSNPLSAYQNNINNSWIKPELNSVRNIRPAFKYGLYPGLAYAAFDTYILRGNAPWTFKHHEDHQQLLPKDKCQEIQYPKPDGKLTFDRLSSVQLTNTFHAENQPCHLTLNNPAIAIDINYIEYASPEIRYCPAKVYEIVYTENEGQKQQQQNNSKQARLQINAQNCIHCKTCDIKDPTQNIVWVPPEGGGGPSYSDM